MQIWASHSWSACSASGRHSRRDRLPSSHSRRSRPLSRCSHPGRSLSLHTLTCWLRRLRQALQQPRRSLPRRPLERQQLQALEQEGTDRM